MIFPILPTFMSEVLGIPKTLIGVIDGVAESVASLLKFASGFLSDRLGVRKPIAVLGYLLSTLVKPLLALARGWGLVFFVRVADRVGKGIRTAPRDALIASSSVKSTRGRAFGLHRALDTAGAFVGTLSAFAVMSFAQRMPYRTAFVLAALPAAVGLGFIVFGAHERTAPSTAQKAKISWRAVPSELKVVIAASMVFALGAFTFTFFILRARDMGVPAPMLPLTYLVYNATYLAGAYPAGALSDRLGKRRVLSAGYGVFAATALGFALLSSPMWAWLLMGLYGFHKALVDGVARALVSDIAKPEAKGSALGMYHTGVGLMQFPSAVLAGALWDAISPRAVFVAGAAIAAAALALLNYPFDTKTSSIKF